MILTFWEVIDIIAMTLFVGFIFKDFFARPAPTAAAYDPLKKLKTKKKDDFLFACALVAPAIVLHEFAHKFVGMSFGLQSTFHAAYFWLALGLMLKLMNFSFIFFIPAYVETIGQATHLQLAFVSVAGPLMNLALWIGCALVLKFANVSRKYIPYLALASKINMFLFIFNMIPIMPFDGGNFFYHLWQAFA
jgi:Zn-dependent protease